MSGRIVFFFKQKTAYEVRISDWSSDVCSSDLLAKGRAALVEQPFPADRVDPALQLGGIEPVLAKIMEAMGNARAVEPAPRLFHRIAVRDAIESQRSEEHTSELQSLMRISYADFCLTKNITTTQANTKNTKNNMNTY